MDIRVRDEERIAMRKQQIAEYEDRIAWEKQWGFRRGEGYDDLAEASESYIRDLERVVQTLTMIVRRLEERNA